MKYLLSALLLTGAPVLASWTDGKAQGWAWYQEFPEQVEEADSQAKSSSEVLTEVRAELEEALANAVLNPSQESIEQYLHVQSTYLERSAKFAELWQSVLLAQPDLDNRAQNPVTQYGVQVRKESDFRDMQQQIRALGQKYGLAFFFNGQLAESQALAEVVRIFAGTHDWSVLAVSLDAVNIPQYPSAKSDNGISAALGVSRAPSIYMIDTEAEQALPVAFSLVSVQELERNIMLQAAAQGVTSE